MEYGIAVNNKFALFDNEDEDPLEVLQRSQEEATKKPIGKTAKDSKENSNAKVSAKNAKNTVKDTKPAVKSVTQPAKVLTPTQEQKQKPTSQNQPPRRDNAAVEKPPRFRQNENAPQRERRPPREDNKDNQRVESEFRPERTELRSEREEFHGRGGGFRRGRGQGRGGVRTEEGGFDRFGKREFERHSGSDRTGLKPVEKREGGGAHNWGTIADAVAEQEQLATKETTEHGTEADPQTNANDESNADAEVAEPEEKQLTLDEWKALQDRNRTKAAFNIRKAGEGVSAAPEWKKMFVLKKKVPDEHDEEEEEEEEEEDDSRGKHKAQLPIQIKFNDSGSRGGFTRRGGRGGRGGASGPGGRRPEGDEPRRGRSERVDAVPNVDNELDFPSLA